MAIRFVLHVLLLLTLTKSLAVAAGSLAKPGCQETCGNINIPYPFGIGPGCYIDKGFAVTCNSSFNPPKPFLTSINLELLEVSFEFTNVHVNNPVITSNCQNRSNFTGSVDLVGSPFSFSEYNIFVAVGCDNLVLFKQQDLVIGGCSSICNASLIQTNGSCYGVNCCRTTIPPFLRFINTTFTSIDPQNDKKRCSSAFLVDPSWFNLLNLSSVLDIEYVHAVFEWGISNGTCDVANNRSRTSVCSTSASCRYDTKGYGYLCFCDAGYEGNPYLPEGCQDIDECADPSKNDCEKLCKNKPGGYECLCPDGYFAVEHKCYRILYSKRSRLKMIIIGISAGLGVLFTLIGGWLLYKVFKRRKNMMLKQKFFKRNGGLLLQQQLSSIEGNVENIKLFTSKELEKATDHYNENRILGQGAQGTVYKGMLIDGRTVAIKKSKIVDGGNIEQFINEVVILSQINHRNVVKLLGCCLETQVPLLVNEFIPNGTLSQYIHNPNEDFLLTWEMRLRIATEVASLIFYLHSAASVPIYHRDIKSTNILLDDKYRAKVSDFGTSRSLTVDQTHLTTKVWGTFGYMDPEYFQSSQFTEKSDVYSFGVVLVELLTGEKAISLNKFQEERSLATHFLLAMKQNHLFEILDTRILKEGRNEEIMAVAMIAKRCLNLNGKKRPTMKEVSVELEGIKMSDVRAYVQQNSEGQNFEEYEYLPAELKGTYWDTASTSTSTSIGTFLDSSTSVTLNDQSLLSNK